MSKKVVDEQEQKGGATNNKTTALLIVGVMLGSAVGSGAGAYLLGKNNQNSTEPTQVLEETINTDESTTDESNSDDEYTPIDVDASEQEVILADIQSEIDYLDSISKYVEVQIGEDSYDGYLYNTHGEILAQSQNNEYTVVFTNDGRCVRVASEGDEENGSTSLTYNSSIDVMKQCKNALNNMNYSGYTLKKVEHTNEDELKEGVREYVIDIRGRDACIALYNGVGDGNSFGGKLIDTIVSYLAESTGGTWEPHIELGMLYSNNHDFMAYLNLMVNDEPQNNWLLLRYAEVPDWQLDEKFYTVEFTEENAEEVCELVAKATSDIYSIIEDDIASRETESNTTDESNTDESTSSDE